MGNADCPGPTVGVHRRATVGWEERHYDQDRNEICVVQQTGLPPVRGARRKLVAASHLNFELEVRDITTREDWFERYQYEIPVLCQVQTGEAGVAEIPLPRLSPRAPQARVEQLIQTYLGQSKAE